MSLIDLMKCEFTMVVLKCSVNFVYVRSAVLNSFWSPHPVRKEKSFCTSCTIWHIAFCIIIADIKSRKTPQNKKLNK